MFGHQDDQQTLNDAAVTTDQQNPVVQDASQSPDSHADEGQDNVVNDEQKPVHPTALLEPSNTTDNLLVIKQQALSQLQPIVSHLDQSPEDKFRTLMMMIQASDDQSLIKSAFEAASHISDERLKAQALLDIVNEINYFTHPSNEN